MTPDVTTAIAALEILSKTLQDMERPANLCEAMFVIGCAQEATRIALEALRTEPVDITNCIIKHAYKENGKPDMCAVCGFEWVDTQAGFDTCEGCLKNV